MIDDYHRSFKHKTGKLSLAMVSLSLIILSGVCLGSLAWYNFNRENTQLAQHAKRHVLSASQHSAAVIHQYFNDLKQLVSLIANDSGLSVAYLAQDNDALKSLQTQLKPLVPGASQLRFLNADKISADANASVPLTEACVYLVQQAQLKKQTLLDIHGAPVAHIDVAAPVIDSSLKTSQSQQMLGAVLVRLELSQLNKRLQMLGVKGYLEIHIQAFGKVNTVARFGNPALKRGRFFATQAIANTPWQLTQWIDVASYPSFGQHSWSIWLAFALGVAVLIGAIGLFYRMLHRRVQQDQLMAINLLGDIQRGELSDHYPVALRDSQQNIAQMVHIAQSLIRMGRSRYAAKSDATPQIGLAPVIESAEASQTTSTSQTQADELGGDELLDGVDLSIDHLQVEENQLSNTNVPASVFRAYDMRGIVNDTLTNELVYEIGRAIGSEAIERDQATVVIARDGRLSGPSLRDSLSQGLQAVGVSVIDIGQVPTPVLYFAAHKLSQGTGVMITGSHNPPDYNGLKLMIGGQTYYGDMIQGLRQRIEQGRYQQGQGSERKVEVEDQYLATIVEDVKLNRPMKLVVDCGNGVAGNLAPALYKKLGCEVIELYCEVDGNFPNHHPDPSKPENIVEICKAVKQHQADIGFAFDGDGDRLGVIDNTGQVIWPDRVLMILAQDVLSRNPGAQIIYDVKCTRNLAKVIEAHGGKPLMWKTGHSFIKAKIQETGALLAGEMSGHIFIKERWFGFDDALYTGARLLEVLAKQVKSSHQVFSALPDTVNTPELNINLQEGEPVPFMESLKSHSDFGDGKLIDIDGIRVEYPDGWGLVRSSNTTPTLVLRFEADNQEALSRIQATFKQQMLAVKPDLHMPY